MCRLHEWSYSHYVGPNIAIIGDTDGFGVVTYPGRTLLIPPVYHGVTPLDLKVKTLLVFERRFEKLVIGIYSPILQEWLHKPQFTKVSIKDLCTLWVWVGKLKGECDITTGDITWMR